MKDWVGILLFTLIITAGFVSCEAVDSVNSYARQCWLDCHNGMQEVHTSYFGDRTCQCK